jgi:predicted aspartyl protease
VPILNAPIDVNGPCVRIAVGVSHQRRQALLNAGQRVPDVVLAQGLIDTGADCTAIDKSIVQKLGLVSTGTIGISTPSTVSAPHICNQYDVLLAIFMDKREVHIASLTMPVIEAPLADLPYQALIGRDVLARGILTYDGQSGQLTLAF